MLADARELVAALPFGRKGGERALEVMPLGAVFGEGEGFLAGLFEEFLVAQRIGDVEAEVRTDGCRKIRLGREAGDPLRRFRSRLSCVPWCRVGCGLPRSCAWARRGCSATWRRHGRCVREADATARGRNARRAR